MPEYKIDQIDFTASGTKTYPLGGSIDAIEITGASGDAVTVSYLGPSGLATALDLVTLTISSGISEVFTETQDWRAGIYKFVVTSAGACSIHVAHDGG